MKRWWRPTRGSLACFSPPVMIATMIIEVGLAVYVAWRYKLTKIGRPVTALLLLLATFQLAEFWVCRGSASGAEWWARVGFSAIALLPPLGLHVAYRLAARRLHWLVFAAYAMAAGFTAVFWLYDHTFSNAACLGNYVIFELSHKVGGVFGLYYYGWLVIGLFVIWRLMHGVNRRARQALAGLAFGYMLFIVPTGLVNALSPQTLRAIPSIMCGFAVLAAFTFAFAVMPATVKKNKRGRRRG